MKVNPKFLMMMAALAAGTASAATPTAVSAGTRAGTVITNTASATYTDPSDNSSQTKNSNSVNTTVTPITGFDIVYSDNSADGTLATTDPLPTNYDKKDVRPGDRVDTIYTVLNNSNIDNYRINFDADTTNSPTAVPAGSVKYYPAGTTDFVNTTPITSVTLNNGQSVNIIQVITIPANAPENAKYAASPKGIAPASTDATQTQTAGTFGQYLETSNVNTPATTGDLEYTRATVTTPALMVIPPPTIPGPGTPPAAPGTGTTPPPGAPTGNTYVPPTNPGTTTITNNPGTVIVLTGDNQEAFPKADNNGTADVVTFVSNVRNTGSIDDTIKIKPDLSGLPAGATIQVLDKNGTALTATGGVYTIPYAPDATTPANTVVATPKNQSAQYQLVVTYRDSDSSPGVNQSDVTVPVAIFSGNVPSTTAKANSTFTIHPPEMSFGDTTGTAPATSPDATQTPTQTVDPSGATNTTKNTTTDRSAVFPMTVKNNGKYTDAFTLTGTVDIKNRDGTTTPVAVKYYTADGVSVITETPNILPGGVYDVLAVIDVPATAAATTGATGANIEPTVKQKAVGKFSTDFAEDNNDKIQVSPTGKVGIAKFVAKAPTAAGSTSTPANNVTNNNVVIFNPADYTKADTEAAPATDITYRIVAKNTFNSPVANFYFSDTVPPNTTFKSLGLTNTTTGVAIVTSKVLYRIGTTGAWIKSSITAPTAQVAGTVIQIALDDDGDGAPDALPTDSSLSADFVVTVK